MHVSDLLACGGGLGVGSHSVLHAWTVSFYKHLQGGREANGLDKHGVLPQALPFPSTDHLYTYHIES
jgi:hypothetical protein